MANSVHPDQTAPIGAVCSGSTLFASILNLSVMLAIICSRQLQQTVILLPAHPASFAHNFVSGMQSFYFRESRDAIVLQTCH